MQKEKGFQHTKGSFYIRWFSKNALPGKVKILHIAHESFPPISDSASLDLKGYL